MQLMTKKEREEVKKEIEEIQRIARQVLRANGHDIRFTTAEQIAERVLKDGR